MFQSTNFQVHDGFVADSYKKIPLLESMKNFLTKMYPQKEPENKIGRKRKNLRDSRS